jgi:hypothetical protein
LAYKYFEHAAKFKYFGKTITIIKIIFVNKLQEVLGRITCLLSSDMTRTAWKTTSQHFFVAAGTSLPSCYLAAIEGDTDKQTHAPNDSTIVERVFVAAGTCLQSRCLAMKERIHRHTLIRGIYDERRRDGSRCRDIQPKFRKDWLRHSKFSGGEGIRRCTNNMEIAQTYLYFFKYGK